MPIAKRYVSDIVCSDSHTVAKVAMEVIPKAQRRKEHFIVLGLDSAGHTRKVVKLAVGIEDACLVSIPAIFKELWSGRNGKYVKRIIAVHNHPSDSLEFSPQDERLSKALAKACQTLETSYDDFIVITETGLHNSARRTNDGMIFV